MTVLEEFKEVATNESQKAERVFQNLPRDPRLSEESLGELRDTILDLRANSLAFYKIAVLEARRVDSAEEVAAIWKLVLLFCQMALDAWQPLHFEPVTQALINDYRKAIEQLKTMALEHWQFHNGLE